MILTGGKHSIPKKILTNATLSSKNHIWACLGLNLGTRRDTPATNLPSRRPRFVPIQCVWDLCGWSATGTGFITSASVFRLVSL